MITYSEEVLPKESPMAASWTTRTLNTQETGRLGLSSGFGTESLDSVPEPGLTKDIENLGGWTEVQSKKTQQKMKALSRQSSANKLVGPGGTALTKKQNRQSLHGKQESGKPLLHTLTPNNTLGFVDKTSTVQHSKTLKKSYSQALSLEGKDSSSNASLSRPELNAQSSKETIIVSEEKYVRQSRVRGNEELLEQYWKYTYDILERTSHEFSRLSLLLKNKDKLEAVIKIVEPLLDLVQMLKNDLSSYDDLPSINPLLGVTFPAPLDSDYYYSPIAQNSVQEPYERPMTWASTYDFQISNRWLSLISRSVSPTKSIVSKRFLSPSPPKSPATNLELERKQAKAQELRQSVLDGKSEQWKSKAGKIEAVRESQQEQIKQLKDLLDEKQKKAEQKRIELLRSANTRKLVSASTSPVKEVSPSQQDTEDKQTTQAMQDAALERRKHQEELRRQRQASFDLRRKETEVKKELEKQQKDADKIAHKQEKLRRLEELRILKQSEEEVFRKELEEKLEMGSKRKEEQMRQVREKAAAANEQVRVRASLIQASRKTPERRKFCLVCNVEDEDHQGHEHFQRCTSPTGQVIFSDRSKICKKKLKKIRHKLRDIGQSYMYLQTASSQKKGPVLEIGSRIIPILREIHLSRSPPLSYSALQSELASLCTILEISNRDDLIHICNSGLLNAIILACSSIDSNGHPVLPQSIINLSGSAISYACALQDNVEYLLCHKDTLAIEIFEVITRLLNYCTPATDTILTTASLFLSTISKCLQPSPAEEFKSHVHIKETIISYILSVDFLEKIRNFYIIVHGPVPTGSPLVSFLSESMLLLQQITLPRAVRTYDIPVFLEKTEENTTSNLSSIVKAIVSTDVASIVTMLDALLLHKGGPTKLAVDERLDDNLIQIASLGIRTLNQVAHLDLKAVQSILNSEGMQPQLFHLVLFWIHYWSTWSAQCSDKGDGTQAIDDLFHELLVLIGYVSLEDKRGREMLRFGQGPVILKVLAGLPFGYFIDPVLMDILFPTLASALYDDELNRQILEEDISLDLIHSYLSSPPEPVDQQGGVDVNRKSYFRLDRRIPEAVKSFLLLDLVSQ